VPGNHDAWNAKHTGTLIDRRQKSLENYNYAFKSHQIHENGCYYDWLEKDGNGIYFAFVDSCFLGDTEDNDDSTFGNIRVDRIDQAVAKGKLTVQQTEKLLEWYDLGTKGNLINPRNKDCCIDKDIFSRSLKILVMHHYLFEPPEHSSDYFMRVHHRDVVFRNIAFSDFDILLCGHKHIPAFDIHTYGSKFDNRAKYRYLINCFRRLIVNVQIPLPFYRLAGADGIAGSGAPRRAAWITSAR
jgi:predicted phosphodiesterase